MIFNEHSQMLYFLCCSSALGSGGSGGEFHKACFGAILHHFWLLYLCFYTWIPEGSKLSVSSPPSTRSTLACGSCPSRKQWNPFRWRLDGWVHPDGFASGVTLETWAIHSRPCHRPGQDLRCFLHPWTKVDWS